MFESLIWFLLAFFAVYFGARVFTLTGKPYG